MANRVLVKSILYGNYLGVNIVIFVIIGLAAIDLSKYLSLYKDISLKCWMEETEDGQTEMCKEKDRDDFQYKIYGQSLCISGEENENEERTRFSDVDQALDAILSHSMFWRSTAEYLILCPFIWKAIIILFQLAGQVEMGASIGFFGSEKMQKVAHFYVMGFVLGCLLSGIYLFPILELNFGTCISSTIYSDFVLASRTLFIIYIVFYSAFLVGFFMMGAIHEDMSNEPVPIWKSLIGGNLKVPKYIWWAINILISIPFQLLSLFSFIMLLAMLNHGSYLAKLYLLVLSAEAFGQAIIYLTQLIYNRIYVI